jgi:hypothetical protein
MIIPYRLRDMERAVSVAMMKKLMISLILAVPRPGSFAIIRSARRRRYRLSGPLQSDTQVLKIAWSGTPVTADKVTVTIMDIKRDEVFVGTYASFSSPIAWNGRNNAGTVVDAGEYLIKVVTENTQTGLLLHQSHPDTDPALSRSATPRSTSLNCRGRTGSW